MKIQRPSVEKRLTSFFLRLEDRELVQKYCLELEQKYHIPIGISSDVLCLRKDLSEFNEFFLFAIVDIVDHSNLKKVFTPRELSIYSGQKFESQNIKFPMRLKMFQVTPDQWIGVSSAQFLMQLREAQFINYNAETQRALEIMTKNGKEFYRPSVDNKSVGEIEEAYANKSFIPNTISLNISQDDEQADFYYAENLLVIKSLTHFDIFDGYHRYLGMARNYDLDNTFNYPIELRITNFSVSKAKQFIYQEDHKTKMKRVNREAYDQQNPGNLICDRLNSNSDFNLYNSINLTDGLINYAELSLAIFTFMCDNGKQTTRKEVIEIANLLKVQINRFTEDYTEYLDKKWERYEVFVLLYGLSDGQDNNRIKAAIDNTSDNQKKVINSFISHYSKKRLLKVMKEVYSNV